MSRRAGVRHLGAPLVVAVAVTLALMFAGTARAATIAVHTPAQLQAAVAAGSPGDTINLDANIVYAVTASLDVGRNLTIQTDPAQLKIAGNRAASISGGVITGASALDPGGNLDIIVVGAPNTLTVHNVVFTGGLQPSNGAIVVNGPLPAGGNGGTLSIDHSLLSSNSTPGVDVKTGGQATVTNSTITQSNGFDGILLDGTGTFNEDTIANNGGNGIDNHGGGIASVNNTILSGNTAGNCFFAITAANGSGSHSDDSGTSCGPMITTGGASSTGTGAGFIAATATNNGGPTNTYAIPAGSVAVNNGTAPPTASTDQRGLIRDATPDIGAFELGAATPVAVDLTVTKIVVNTGGGTALPSDFTMTVTDTTTGTVLAPSPFPGSNAGTHVTIPAGDSWVVTESGAQTVNYTAGSSPGCTGSATANATASCTFTNTFIVGSCPQPPATTSANTCVTANVAATIIVTAPGNISFPALPVGGTSSPTAVPVNVKSNDPLGYQLNVTRTAFTGSPPDIPLSIGSGAVSFPQALDLPGGPIGPSPNPPGTPIPTSGPNLNIGHNTTAITPAAGDDWPFTFVLGPIPQISAGQHTSVVTFTAVAF